MNELPRIEITPIVRRRASYDIGFLDEASARRVAAFHASFPMYAETPLAALPSLAKTLGVRGLYVKDESFRFGLNAFKALGGSYAAGQYIAKRLGLDISELPFARMVSEEIRARLGDVTFVTATDGNHGRGVAWTARQLRQGAVVYMPRGTKAERLENIRREGADASILDDTYDGCVRHAARMAAENGWVLTQDTDFKGYREIPRWIMEGYGTMALEAYRQIPEPPTHIFLQAGVGSMAGAVAGFFANVLPVAARPIITVAEPETADCVFRTARAADGRLHAAGGDLETMMAGLACGEPCGLAWEVLESCADFALVCTDEVSARGMRLLARPTGGDPRVVSGESGAVTTGLAATLLTHRDAYPDIIDALGLDERSVILCFSTEGATDRENYRRVTGTEP